MQSKDPFHHEMQAQIQWASPFMEKRLENHWGGIFEGNLNSGGLGNYSFPLKEKGNGHPPATKTSNKEYLAIWSGLQCMDCLGAWRTYRLALVTKRWGPAACRSKAGLVERKVCFISDAGNCGGTGRVDICPKADCPHWRMLLGSPCGVSWRCSKTLNVLPQEKACIGMFAKIGRLTTKRASHTQAKWKTLVLLPLLFHSWRTLEEPRRTDEAEEELGQGWGWVGPAMPLTLASHSPPLPLASA